MPRPLLFALCLALAFSSARAEVRLPKVIGSHMVLQQGKPLPIWGWADPGQTVSVTLEDKTLTATADKDGKWKVEFEAKIAAPDQKPLTMTISGKDPAKKITLTDILIGEVWLCSGQSNMEWSVGGSENGKTEIQNANFPQIRLFHVPRVASGLPAKDVDATWRACEPNTIGRFSAVGYFFGRKLHKDLKVPVGLIASSWVGTRIEPWTPPEGFRTNEELSNLAEWATKSRAGYLQAKAKALDETAQWLPKAQAAAKANLPIPDPPRWPRDPVANSGAPTALYNGMIHPLVPYAIAGSIWYQGESNRGLGMHYHQLMKALIAGWRTVWNQGDFPFYYVQLAPYDYRNAPTALPEIWEAQTATLQVPNTGMAIITDIGNVKDIHPRNKQEVGRRLALWALAKTYGQTDLVYSGPIYKSMKVEGDKIRITFNHAAGGLASRDDKPLTWFSIAGEDMKFVDAQAVIDKDTVVISSDQVKEPTAVRFGWNHIAEPNLINKAGLPASPFRTDKPKEKAAEK